jgi:sirohydrochlorin ferrochelatase
MAVPDAMPVPYAAQVAATLLLAAHGTRSAAGSSTTAAVAAAVQAARPDVAVELCFLDVAAPSLAHALDALVGRQVVVVPLLLSAGYHVHTDIPRIVAGRSSVRVARHLGPDPAVIQAVAQRLAEADGAAAPVLLAAVPSSQPSARVEVADAATRLAARLGQPVTVLPLGGEPELPATPFAVAVYLLAEGGFLNSLRARVAGRAVVADPIGAHPAVIALAWARYDEVNRA